MKKSDEAKRKTQGNEKSGVFLPLYPGKWMEGKWKGSQYFDDWRNVRAEGNIAKPLQYRRIFYIGFYRQ